MALFLLSAQAGRKLKLGNRAGQARSWKFQISNWHKIFRFEG
jgi:hypothetical protein